MDKGSDKKMVLGCIVANRLEDKKAIATLEPVYESIVEALHSLVPLFIPGMRLTLVARLPGNVEASLVVSADDLEEVAKAVLHVGGLGIEKGGVDG